MNVKFSIKTVCVCGAGTMGTGIAEVFALAGYKTILYDVDENILSAAKEKISGDLERMAAKEKISIAEKENAWNLIQFAVSLQVCKADLILEAIIEKLEAKVSLLKDLAEINPTAILCSNTSSLSLTVIADKLKHPEQLIGLHFFNPAPLMQLVEVIYTVHTKEETKGIAKQLISRLGKTAVVCKDSPGFIVNRIARPFYIEALRIAEVGKVSLETIDRLLEARGFKLGPFKLMDLIGNDINYAVSKSIYGQLGNTERLKPSYLQKEKVDKGELGKKTGKGYYNY